MLETGDIAGAASRRRVAALLATLFLVVFAVRLFDVTQVSAATAPYACGVEQAVTAQDVGRLVKVPGIGKKTAERLLLELKGKLGPDLGINFELFTVAIPLWLISESLVRFPSPQFRWYSGLVGFGALAIHLSLAATLPGLALLALFASTLIAQRSLYAHVRDVAVALDRSLEDGRAAVALIVGRNVEELDEAGVSRAAVESLAENFSDGVVAPTFWLALAGLPGAALYKAINTADSMIGHKTERYRDFGYAAAKIDDVVNWPAARISGALIVGAAALGRATYPLRGWRVMKRDAGKHVSPNAGWPEAAMAGALHVRLGGPRAYGGNVVAGAWLGDADEPVDRATIRRALKLYRRACVLQFFGLAFVGALLV